MILPTLHANGTSPEALIAALEAQFEALNAARLVLARYRPNSRDYTAETYVAADTQHSARMQRIVTLQSELVQEMAAITAHTRRR